MNINIFDGGATAISWVVARIFYFALPKLRKWTPYVGTVAGAVVDPIIQTVTVGGDVKGAIVKGLIAGALASSAHEHMEPIPGLPGISEKK